MKRNFFAIFFLCFLHTAMNADSGALSETSNTTLSNAQVPFSSVSPEMVSGFRIDRTYAQTTGKHGAFQAVLFGGRSTNTSGLARYFFPHGQDVLVVAEDDLLDNFDKKKDLLAQNFNIFTNDGTFRSEISIAPKETIIGIGFHWRECFLRNIFTGNGIWVSASAPLLHVVHNIHLHERIFNDGGGPNPAANNVVVANMTQALNQSVWNFGKMKTESVKTTQLADIELKLGYDQWLDDELSQMELYVGIIIPTSNKHKAIVVFEPIAGRDRHVGIMTGGSFGKELISSEAQDVSLSWQVAVHGEYLFKNTQTRSFDLVDKPWSRYIPLYADLAQAQQAQSLQSTDPLLASNLATPGINILTQRVSVTPGFSFDMNSALVWTSKKVEGEVGYNLFFKRAESVKLACPWVVGPAIKYTSGLGQTNPIRDITGNKYLEQEVFNNSGVPLIPVVLANFDQSLLMQQDLDLHSAATPALFSHTLYATIGYHIDDRRYPLMTNVGFSYTFSQNNAVVNKWMMWIKGAVSF